MTQNPPQEDPKAIWKNLNTEKKSMSVEAIRGKAQALHTKMRRDAAITAIITLAVGTLVAIRFLNAPATQPRVILTIVMVLILAGLASRIYTAYRTHGRVWSRVLPRDAGLTTSLAFYRRELERQYRSYSRAEAVYLPFLLGIVALFLFLIVARQNSASVGNVIPFCVILLAWSAGMFFISRRETRRYRRALDELDNLDPKDSE